MAWPTPQFTKGETNRAGKVLADPLSTTEDLDKAHEVLGNWRACHGYPIDTFQATLRNKLAKIDKRAIVAQRLKRTPSIVSKLRRFDTMMLARMQDIGGLRAVVSNLDQVRLLRDSYNTKRCTHPIIKETDYIANPKKDGYRSLHLVFQYRSEVAVEYNGLALELQIRTQLQHAWATAVEIMSTFLNQALKSDKGDLQWLKFFEVTGAAFAHIEESAKVPGYDTLTKSETFREVMLAESQLKVLDKLKAFRTVVKHTTKVKSGGYHLIVLNYVNKNVLIWQFPLKDLKTAVNEYAAAEARAKQGEPIEAVLVSAGPIDLLRKAYPNYFLDSDDFVKQVESIIRSASNG